MMSLSFIHIISALFFFFTPPETISKNTLSQLQCICELNPILPTDIKVFTINIVAKKEGKVIVYGSDDAVILKTLTPTGCMVNQEVRDFLSQVDIGCKVYFDFKYLRINEELPRIVTLGLIVTD